MKWATGIRSKLICIFVLIKVLPLLALAWFAWSETGRLAAGMEQDVARMISQCRKVINDVSRISTESSIKALDDKSRETIEHLTTDLARAVASFLYDRDRDIELAAVLPRSETQYRRFLASRHRPVILHPEWKLNQTGDAWEPAPPALLNPQHPAPSVTAQNEDNRKEFHSRPPEEKGIPEERPLYLEMSFIDLDGTEQIKVTTSDLLSPERRNISDPRHTYCKAETYFEAIQDLAPGDIYVSEVIGPYVKGHLIGPYGRVQAEKRGIPFAPEASGYAGKENPVGKRFQGLIRWCTPVTENGRKIGYVTLALDHTHIMEFTDHTIPTEERYSPISDAGSGNYAFMWDYKGRNISHPRDYFIVGFDPNTGERAAPWMDEELYALYRECGQSMTRFEEKAPQFNDQRLNKKPAPELTRAGLLGLDGRYLNFAPQCTGWHNLTRHGGSGSFLIFWSGLWKLSTAATIPYHTGLYGEHPRGFGYVTIGANVHEFHRAAQDNAAIIQDIEEKFETDLDAEKEATHERIRSALARSLRELGLYTMVMVAAVILIAIFMAAALTQKITSMIQGIRQFEEEDLHHRLQSHSGDEMGELADAFNRMADTVQRNIEELKTVNARLTAEIEERRKAQEALALSRDTLENRVNERTEELKREVEERQRMEARLHRLEKMEALETLAGGVAHDLNNILSGLVSYPDLLLLKLPEDSPLRGPVTTISQSGKRASVIVQDLLTLARRGVSVNEVVNLNSIIRTYLESPEHLKMLSFHPDVEIRTRLKDTLFHITGSEVHLMKSLMNLMSNAMEAMPDGGVIDIITENVHIDTPVAGYDDVEKGDYVALKVSDTGEGIESEDMCRIFEPFYTRKKMGRSGTGLGMAVVWGTVKDHNGYIDVCGRKNEGTRFTLYFPATQAPLDRVSRVRLSDYPGKGESVLVIDDVAEQREIAMAILTELGYRTHAVSSGEEAVRHLQTEPQDLILLDMIMDPGMDGLDTYREILSIRPGQKAIIASGFSETDRLREALRLGVNQYLKKPYDIESLAIAIRAALDETGSGTQSLLE